MAAAKLDGTGTLRPTKPQEPMAGSMTAQMRDQAAESGQSESLRVEEARRIMREAAWARMFGKSGSANPFARS